MAMTESQKKYEKKRMEKCKSYTTKYRLYIDEERIEQERLEKYLQDTGQSANAWIKQTIKKELDSLGWETETDQEQITDIDTTGIE